MLRSAASQTNLPFAWVRDAAECEAALLRVQTVLQAVHERAMAALDWRDPRPHLVRLISVVTSPSHFVR